MKKKTVQKRDKNILIRKLFDLLLEKNKGKEWVLEQIEKQKITINEAKESSSLLILQSCPSNFIENLLKILREEKFLDSYSTKSTRTLHWFFTDIVGSANPKIQTEEQIKKINFLFSQIQNSKTFRQIDFESDVILPTGDGMAIGFSSSPEQPFLLAIEISKALNNYNKNKRENAKIQLRIGLDSGPVYFIKDVQGNNTVWGPGIITARRVMDLCDANHILASQKIAEDLSKLTAFYKNITHPLGEYKVKHDEEFYIYNIYGMGFGNKNTPSKVVEQRDRDKNEDLIPNFEFNYVEVRLDVKDPKTMMTHHKWIWDVKNNSKKPLEQVFYNIGGDVPKDFRDLHISIKDEKNKKQEILTIDENKELEKKFNVKLAHPIRRKQHGRILKLEYDWEEPNRVFQYDFSGNCKRFKYVFTIPSGIEIKNRVLQVVRELGIKKRAEPPAKIRYLPKKIEVTWENDKKNKINRFDSYEFQW